MVVMYSRYRHHHAVGQPVANEGQDQQAAQEQTVTSHRQAFSKSVRLRRATESFKGSWFGLKLSLNPGLARMRLLLSLFLVCATATALGKNPEAGRPAPSIDAVTLDGERFSLADHAGKVVIIHFWATWCEPCRVEMPLLDAFYQKHRSEGVEVIAISLDEPEDIAQVKKVMGAFSFPAALISQTKAKGYGRLWRIPLTFVVDRHGVLRRDAWTAAPKVDAAALDAELLPLLKQP
jgi:thiol-disulfide isomerase/thioredoxin